MRDKELSFVVGEDEKIHVTTIKWNAAAIKAIAEYHDSDPIEELTAVFRDYLALEIYVSGLMPEKYFERYANVIKTASDLGLMGAEV